MSGMSSGLSSVAMDGVSGRTAEASSPPGAGALDRLVTRDLTGAPASRVYNAQRPSGPAAQRPSGPAAQRPSGPAAQRPSGMTCARRPAGAHRPAPSTPAEPVSSSSRGSSRTEPRPGRRRARLFHCLPALALLLGALGPFAAAPAAADVLVSNIGQIRATTFYRLSNPTVTLAQGFTTGNHASGYELESIEASMGTTTTLTPGEVAKVRAELRTRNHLSSSRKLADLTVPSTITSGIVTFTAPVSVRLAANTPYQLVVYAIDGQPKLNITYTVSDDEDDGAASGWSITNNGSRSSEEAGQGTLELLVGALRIRVNGSLPPPLEPTGLTVGSGDGKLDLSWTAPSGAVTGYDVHYTASATVANYAAAGSDAATGWVAVSRTETDPPTASQSITGLTGGTNYRVRVRVVDSQGNGAWAFGTGTPNSPPGAVTSLTATPGAAKLDLSWTAPAGTVTGYDVHYTASATAENDAAPGSDAATGWVDASHTGTTASHAITGLTGGTDYRVRVRAVNANGADAWAFGAGTVPGQNPSAPRNVRVTPGEGKLTLTWQAPGSWGEWPAQGYEIEWKRDATDAEFAFANFSLPTPEPYEFARTDTQAYILRIRARASKLVGFEVQYRYSPWVETVSARPLATATAAPGAVTSLKATPGAAKLDLSWTAPSGQGVGSYDVHVTSSTTVDDDAAVLIGRPISEGWRDNAHNSRRPSHTIRSLAVGTSHRVRVRAKNSQGAGPWVVVTGTPVQAVAQWARPGVTVTETDADREVVLDIALSPALTGHARFSLSQTGGDAQADADWSAGACSPGFPGARSLTCAIVIKGDDDVESAETIELTLGVDRGAVGVGTRSVITVTIEDDDTLPAGTVWSATLNVKEELGGNVGCGTENACASSLTDATFSVGGTDYSVTAIYLDGGALAVALDTVPNSALNQLKLCVGSTAFTISGAGHPQALQNLRWSNTGLSWSTGDTVKLSIGTTCPTGTTPSVPAAPTGLDVTAGNAKLDLTWTAPSGTVTGYDVHYTSSTTVGDDDAADGSDPSAKWVAVSRTETDPPTAAQSITSLTNGTPYRVRVRAKNAAGAGAWVRDTGTPAVPTAPSVPGNVTVTPGDAKLTLNWEAPASWGTWTAAGYDIRWKFSSAHPTEWARISDAITGQPIQGGPTDTSIVFAGTQTDGSGNSHTVTNGTAYDLRIGAFAQDPNTDGSQPSHYLGSGWATLSDNTPTAAVAPVPGGLVSNVGQTGSGSTAFEGQTLTVMQFFRTGSHTDRYALDSITAQMTASSALTAAEVGRIRAELWRWGATQKTADLTVPPGIANASGAVRFDAPPGTVLQGDLGYGIAIYATSAVSKLSWHRTSSNNEDAGAASGWSIANENFTGATRPGTTLTQGSDVFLIRVDGAARAAPAAPAELTVTAGDARLDVSWTAPSDTGHSAITGYDVHYTSSATVGDDADGGTSDPAAGWTNAGHSGTTASQALTGLFNGTAYRVRVRAKNAVGAGAWVRDTGTPAADAVAPSVPQNVAVTAGDAKLTLAWEAPASWGTHGAENGWFDVQWYAPDNVWQPVRVGGNLAALQPTDTSLVFTGVQKYDGDTQTHTVVNGTAYRLRIRASTQEPGTDGSLGSHYRHSAWVTLSDNTPAVPTAPAAPTDLSVTAPGVAGWLRVTWTAPSGPVTGYDVHYTSASADDLGNDDAAVDGGDPAAAWVDAGHDNTAAAIVLTGLTVGTEYRVRVRAVNGGGDGAWARGTGTPPGAAVLPAPGSLTVRAGDGRLDLSWTRPSGQVTGWDVHYTSASMDDVGNDDDASGADPAAAWVAASRTGLTPTHALTGLTNGTAYRVRVRGVNSAGDGAWARRTGTPRAAVSMPVRGAPAGAHTLWTATLTVQAVTTNNAGQVIVRGCSDSVSTKRCVTNLSDNSFRLDGTDYEVTPIQLFSSGGLLFKVDKDLPGDKRRLVLMVGDTAFWGRDAAFANGRTTLNWTNSRGLVWSAGETVSLSLVELPTVHLTEVAPNPVAEGWPVSVEVCLRRSEDGNQGSSTWRSHVPRGTAVIPLVVTAGTAERRDYGEGPPRRDGTRRYFIYIHGSHQRSCGVYNIPTQRDGDHDDETFTVALDANNLPSSMLAGGTTSVEVRIEDLRDAPDEGPPVARLVLPPRPVPEGGPLTVTVKMSSAQAHDVTVPVVVTRGSSEAGDHGTLSGIVIPGGSISGRGEIMTVVDGDADDETFTVALDTANLPASMSAGDPASVSVTIADGGAGGAYAALIAKMREWRNDPQWVHAKAHTDRWDRALKAFGEPVADATLTAMTAAEAQGYANRGWTRWVEVARALREIEATRPRTPAPPAPVVTIAAGSAVSEGAPAGFTVHAAPAPAADLAVAVSIAQSGEFAEGSALGARTVTIPAGSTSAAFTVATVDDDTDEPDGAVTAALAGGAGYTVGDASSARVAVADDDTPVVTIAAGNPVTEGAPAGFTVHAAPVPASDLAVAVSIAQSGEFAEASALGARTVTIPAGTASAAFAVATVDDDTDEPDGAVTAALAGGDGYTVGDASSASVAVADDDEALPGLVTKRSMAREGRDEAVVFWVLLERAAPETVTVDWATADGAGSWARTPPATAGADYTASSGTLAFAPGETLKSVSVPILDDAIDEGTEYFLLRFSNPRGAALEARYRETQGLIRNDDHLQSMWLARFGRTVGTQVTDAVSERLQGGLSPGAHATLAGQRVDLSKADDGKALAEVMTGLARTFGAPSGPAANDGPGSAAGTHHGLADPWNDTATTATARPVTGRELLLGSSFHLATGGERAGPGLAAWGRVAQAGFEGEHADDTGRTSVDGTVMTGVLGADADFGRLLAGVAVSLSEGDGSFDNPGADVGGKGGIESTMTTVSPYARFKVTERVTAWGLAGWGTGDMTIRFDDGSMAPVRTDLSMQLGAVGARGELLRQDDAGGMDLALKADAFFVRTESEQAANSAETQADASRLRLVLEGGRAFVLGGGATVRPSLELGVRHDGGDAETGTGVEVGGGVAFTDADSGLSIEARARMLVAHADSDYEEWGASATARLDPGARGRGLSFSLAPTIGATSSAAERLWGAHDARGLAPGSGEFEAARGLQGEMGYGMALLGDRFTGTPNLGFGMSDGGARDWRIGWRLTSAVEGDPGFEVSLDATRREAANDNAAEHGVMLRSLIRW